MKRILIITLTCLLFGVLHSQGSNPFEAEKQTDGMAASVTAPYSATDKAAVAKQSVAADENELKLPDSATPSQQKKARELNSKDSSGSALTLMSMGIVVTALAVLSILFLLFGKISASLQKRRKHRVIPVANVRAEGVDSGEAIAAIGAALAEHFSGKHDMEDTILTIKRMRRAYSPWNSKIYNIRVAPEVHKH